METKNIKNIIVVDDDRSIRVVISTALTRAGYNVKSSGTAAGMWRLVESDFADVLITDVGLPDGDALDILPKLQKNNPDLKIIAAHILSMSNDIDAVAQRLEAYPNLSVELGARFGDLAMQDSEKVRNFFDKYQDRILFGTDYGTGEAEDQKSSKVLIAEAKNLQERYQLLFDYLTKQDSMVLRKQQTKGLALSKTVLEKIFSKNYLKYLTRSN